MRKTWICTAVLGLIALLLTFSPLVAIGEPETDLVEVPAEALVVDNGVVKGVSKAWATENYPDGASFSVTIPAGATSIANYAFDSNYVGKDVLQMSGGYSVGAVDFSGACDLASIGNQAFLRAAVTKVDLSGTRVATIGKLAFSDCANLTEVTLPATLESLGSTAGGGTFSNDSALARVKTEGQTSDQLIDLPEGLTYIAQNTFQKSMTGVGEFKITLPASLAGAGNNAFDISNLTQIVVPHRDDSDFSGFTLTSLTWNKTSAQLSRQVIFDCQDCWSAFTAAVGANATTKRYFTYPYELTFKGAGEDGGDLIQTKLAYLPLQFEADEDGAYWTRDYDYELPALPTESDGYTSRWVIGTTAIYPTITIGGVTEVDVTAERVFDTNVEVTFTADGQELGASYTLAGNTGATPALGVATADVVLDGETHEIGVTVTHPLTKDALGTDDDYVRFEYCWYDEVSTYTNGVIDSTPYGPRSVSEPELFSSATNEVWTDSATIPVSSVSDERTDHDGLGDYYLVKIRAYHVVNGVETLFLETSHNFIGVGSSVNPASLLMQVSTKVAVTYDTNDGGGDAAKTLVCEPGDEILLEDVAVPAGMKFLGWDAGDGTLLEPGDTFTVTGPTTLTARWETLERGTITPVSLTAYVGGVSAAGGTMPKIRYAVTTPEGTTLDGLTFTLHTVTDGVDEETPLTRKRIDTTDDDSLCLFPELDSAWNQDAGDYEESDTAVQRGSYIKAIDAEGDGTYAGTYEILGRDGTCAEWDSWYVTASDAQGNVYYMDLVDDSDEGTSAKLTILTVSDEEDMYENPSTYLTRLLDDIEDVTTENLAGQRKAAAIADENLTFLTNGDERLGLIGCESSDDVDGYGDGNALVALLFDDMTVSGEGDVDELADRVVEAASDGGEDLSGWEREFKYLDLVNVNDGNAKLTIADGGSITVVWPYPEGITCETAGDYTFKLVHCPDLDRDYAADSDGEIETELIDVTACEQGLVFKTDGFSPYMLLWTKNAEPEAEEPAVDEGDDGDAADEENNGKVADEDEGGAGNDTAPAGSEQNATPVTDAIKKVVPDTGDATTIGAVAILASIGCAAAAGGLWVRKRSK